MNPNRWAVRPARYALAALGLVAAAVFAPSVLAQAPAPPYFGGESWMPQQVESGAGDVAPVTAAEVAADRDLWIRSGMASAVQGEAGPDQNSLEYRERLAVYSTLKRQQAQAMQQPEVRDPQVAAHPGGPRSF